MKTRIAILCAAWMCLAPAAPAQDALIRMGAKPAELIFTKITVSDLRRSFDFYTKIVGLKQVNMPGRAQPNIDDPSAARLEVAVNYSGSAAESMLSLLKQKGATPVAEHARLTWIGLKTTNVRAVIERARASGFAVTIEPHPTLGMLFGQIRDPDGYLVSLLEVQSVRQ